MPAELRGRSPAKINLSLEVLGPRGDGYHEVDTIVQPLELSGEVHITFEVDHGVIATGPFASGTPEDASNLAWRAAEALAAVLRRPMEPMRIALDKQVPPAGGLGGGAADAAAVLQLLRMRWRAPREAVLEAAAAVGSDEPALVLGGPVRAQGRGELVTPLREGPPMGVVLFVPPATIAGKTARLFAELARHPFDAGGVTAAMVERWPGPFSSIDVYNAFERVAFDVFAGLAQLWEDLEERLNAGPGQSIAEWEGVPRMHRHMVRLAGAGPTLFWLGPVDLAAEIATRAAGAACTILPTRTASPSWKR